MTSQIEYSVNASTLSAVQQALLALDHEAECDVKLNVLEPSQGVLSGVRHHGRFQVKGDVGDYCALSFGEGDVRIDGSVGNFFSHSLASGQLVVHGNAKDVLGALGTGGLIAVYGNAGDRAGFCLQGADIVVRGSAGADAGAAMRDGTLIIGGNAGTDLGRGMRGGTIYLRGEAASISSDIEEVRIKESDKLKIGLLMLKAGIKVAGKEFKVYRSV